MGKSGQVYSFESTPRHMHAAVSNYKRWCANWELVHGGEGRMGAWPDNVLFVEADASDAASHVTSEVDAVSYLGGEVSMEQKVVSVWWDCFCWEYIPTS